MHKFHTTVIVPLRKPWKEHGLHRFAKSVDAIRHAEVKQFGHPEIIAYPHGTSKERMIYSLGHQGDMLPPVYSLTPSHWRHIRENFHQARSNQQELHLVSVADHDSPYGSRRPLEELLMSITQFPVSTTVNLLDWNATPKEMRRIRDDITAHPSKQLSLGYDGSFSTSHAYLPYEREPKVLVLNHQGSGIISDYDQIVDATHLPVDFAASEVIVPLVASYKHVQVISNRPVYGKLFAGDVSHSYFEEQYVDEPNALLEMLISPHYGYTQKPYYTCVVIDESADPEFDWLLASYLKQIRTNSFAIHFLDPWDDSSSYMLTNSPATQIENVYRYSPYLAV